MTFLKQASRQDQGWGVTPPQQLPLFPSRVRRLGVPPPPPPSPPHLDPLLPPLRTSTPSSPPHPLALTQVPVAHALLAGGIDVMELVLRTPAAERALALVASHVPRMLVGAGTVLTIAQAGGAAVAGARFLVAPGTNPTIVKHAHAAGLPILPGVATATEVEAAFALGLTRLKFFPAVPMGGAKTLGALSAPYPHARWMPTGGVSPANLEDFFRLKQVFAAGGAWVVPRDALAARDYARVEALAREATQAVKALRSDSR